MLIIAVLICSHFGKRHGDHKIAHSSYERRLDDMKAKEIEEARGKFGPVAVRALAVGAQSIGAAAAGAIAISALTVGFIAIGRLVIGRAKIKRLEIGELRVTRLRVSESLETPNQYR
jgi:hypothetical protein